MKKPNFVAFLLKLFKKKLFWRRMVSDLEWPTSLKRYHTNDLKGQYHAIFSNTLKIEKTLFG